MREKPRKWGIGFLPVLLMGLAGLVVLIVMLTIALALVGTYFSSPNEELAGSEAEDFIAERFFALPEDAREVYLYYFSIQDYKAYSRFSADPAAIEAWLQELDLCFSNLSASNPLYNTRGEVLAWWNPNPSFSNTGLESCETNPRYQLSIDQSASDVWIVYLLILGS